MKNLFQESTKKILAVSLFSVLLICFTYVGVKINSERKWFVKDSAIKVEEIQRFNDGEDTVIIIKIFVRNSEYISTYTKNSK